MQYQSPAKIGALIGKERRWVIARCNEGIFPHIIENGRFLIDAEKIHEVLSQLEKSFKPLNSNLMYHQKPSSKFLYKL